MNKRILLLTCAGVALSFAGEASAQAQAAAAEQSTVGEVVVTAEKRSVNVQKVPVAVSAFTAKQRNLEGINTIQDITNFTPGLTYSTSLDRAAMRGLARLSNTLSADSSVAVYNDDLYSTSTYLVGLDDLFVSQIEIERGPQGTLYGRNAIGGLINTTSRRPTDDFSGEVRAEYGNYDHSNFEGTLSGPTGINGLDFRVSGYDTNQNGGYLTNIAPGKPQEGGIVHDWYGNAMLEYKPTDRDDLFLDFYDYGFEGDRSGPGSLLGTPLTGAYDTGEGNFDTSNLTFNPNFGYSTQTGFNTLPGLPVGGFARGPVPDSVVGAVGTGNPALQNIRDFAHSIPTSIHLHDSWTINFHWTHHFDGFDVKYVGGYSQYHYNLHSSLFYGDNSSVTQYTVPLAPGSACSGIAGCTPLTVFPSENYNYREDNSWFSHELTFSSTNDSPLQWIAGVYYYDQSYHDPITVSLPQQAQEANPISGLTGAPAAANPSRDWYYTSYQLETKSTAIYGQIDYKLSDMIKLTGGLRYTYDQKSGIEDYRLVAFSNVAANPGCFGALVANAATCPTHSPELSAENLGSRLPAIDVTASAIGAPLNTSYKGVTCLPHLLTNGQYERCLGDTSSATTGTAGVEFTPNRDTLAYVRYNRGYKAFGFNSGTITANPEALPETVDDVEIGLKQSLTRTFQYNLDFFYYNYMDDQVPISVPNGGLVTTQFVNIPKSVSEGVELQMIWSPIRHLSLNFTYSFDDTFITSNCSAVNGVATGTCFVDVVDPLALAKGAKPVGNLIPGSPQFPFTQGAGTVAQSIKGDALPQAPKNKIAFNANYTWQFEPGDFTLSGTYVWKDKSYSGVFTRTYYEAPSWNQVDLRGTWAGDHDRYEVILFVKNLFNTLGYDAAGGATAGYTGNPANPTFQQTAFDLTPPRTYGVEVHYKF
ncbi:MAG TPA: TonB-dependent receptor [Caulobacteraceae bacterium]|jgi:iron complex outermembrane receptor protein|nr:TonB-dependent receptor [Caulobacteraceae bacterium]